MREDEVEAIWKDIKPLSKEAKAGFIIGMIKEDQTVSEIPFIKHWIKKNPVAMDAWK